MKFFLFFLFLFPPSPESLRYTIHWATGPSPGGPPPPPGKGKEAWDFEVTMDASVPGFTLRDRYQSAATLDLCSLQLEKTFTHGNRKADEKMVFDQQNHSASRETKNGGGKSDVSISSCAKDALTFMQFARRELAQ